MARARNIKPKFFTNEDLVELSFATRLLFIGLWTLADREGRLEDRPKRIKMDIFPADQVDVEAGLGELAASGFLLRYEADGARYIQIVSFCKHQNPHKDERASTIPEPVLHECCTVQDGFNDDANRACTPIPCTPILNKNQRPPAAEYPVEFLEAYEAYPSRPGMNKQEAFKAWGARIKSGASPPDITAGVLRYANYCAQMKTERTFIKMPSTFFGPNQHYLTDWTPTPETRNGNDRAGIVEDFTGANRRPREPAIQGESHRVD